MSLYRHLRTIGFGSGCVHLDTHRTMRPLYFIAEQAVSLKSRESPP